MTRPNVHILEGVEALAMAAADRLDRAIREAVAAHGACSVALSGGTTPRPILQRLAGRALPWEKVDFFFVDERCVPPDHPDSNFKMANEALFQPARLAPARIHRMEGERADREAAARDYEARLPAALDVVLLGVGEDGHTASLFPGSALLDEAGRRVAPAFGPKPPPWRLTLTPPALKAARVVLVVTAGKGKAHAVARALESDAPVKEVPARLGRDGDWFLDREAAAGLAAGKQGGNGG